MDYISEIYALNLPSPDGTPGDWHYSALDWSNVPVKESSCSPFGEWELFYGDIPGKGRMLVASHMRACLDLIEENNFGTARGMRDLFLSDDSLAPIVFRQVIKLKNTQNWLNIDAFLGREYGCMWLDFKKENNCGQR